MYAMLCPWHRPKRAGSIRYIHKSGTRDRVLRYCRYSFPIISRLGFIDLSIYRASARALRDCIEGEDLAAMAVFIVALAAAAEIGFVPSSAKNGC